MIHSGGERATNPHFAYEMQNEIYHHGTHNASTTGTLVNAAKRLVDEVARRHPGVG